MSNARQPRRRLPLVLSGGMALMALLLAPYGCTVVEDAGSGASRPDSPGFDRADGEADDMREFNGLPRDQSGGTEFEGPMTVSPNEDELAASSAGDSSRHSAEVFAVLMNHSFADSTTSSVGQTAVDGYALDLPADSRAQIDQKSMFPDSQIVAGSRSWIRSSISGAGDEITVDVHLVEQYEVPSLGDTAEDPYICWVQSQLTIVRDGDAWRVADYQDAIASESREFSRWAWKGVMDSGKDWRRVPTT